MADYGRCAVNEKVALNAEWDGDGSSLQRVAPVVASVSDLVSSVEKLEALLVRLGESLTIVLQPECESVPTAGDGDADHRPSSTLRDSLDHVTRHVHRLQLRVSSIDARLDV